MNTHTYCITDSMGNFEYVVAGSYDMALIVWRYRHGMQARDRDAGHYSSPDVPATITITSKLAGQPIYKIDPITGTRTEITHLYD